MTDLEKAKQFRQGWSHAPTPIPPNATGLWYSEECCDQMLVAYASHSNSELLAEKLAAEERVRELTKEADEIRHEIVQCDDIKLDQPIVNCIADMQKDREQKWERLSVMETALKQIWAIARNSRRSTHVEDLDEIQARANQALSDQGGNNGA